MVGRKLAREPESKGYAWLAAELRAAIDSGEISVGETLPATKILGERYGTSAETARRAAKQLQQEGLVASEPRQGFRVLARVNDPDRGLPFAFVVGDEGEKPGMWNVFNRLLFAGLQNAASEHTWSVLAVGAGKRSGQSIMEQLKECRAWGVVLDSMHAGLVEAVTRMGMPVVMMDAWQPEMKLDAVVQDSFQGVLFAVNYLVARGHERIAWLGKIGESVQSQERFGGFCAGMGNARLKLRADWMLDTRSEKTADHARRLLSQRDRPTAIVAPWIDESLQLARAADELGLKQDRNLEIIGWAAEEHLADGLQRIFGGLPVPAMMTWSITELAQVTLERLALRRSNPGMPPLLLKVPARLRLPDDSGKKERTG